MLQPQQLLQQCYQLQQKLGRTAAGRQTWLATDLSSDERVIVKLLAFNPQMEWNELKLFEREARVLQALNHPHIPRYRDYFSLDRQMFDGVPWFGLVQDYIPGYSIQELLESGKHFTEQQVRIIAERVLEILIYLHELSPPVLHRDIKPSNLILGDDGYIYLVDFGAVQARAAVTGVTFTVVGTSGYAPLEQFWGRAVAASDLYALGATLIHLLTGANPADLPIRDSRIQFRDRLSLDSSFVSWLEMMTEMALEKRFSSAKQALEALKSEQICSASTIQHYSIAKEISKPKDTYIELHKSATNLQIRIPGYYEIMEKSSSFWNFLIFFLPIEIILAFFLVLKILPPWSIAALIESIPIGLFMFFIALILLSPFRQTYIYFSRTSFQVKTQIFRFTLNHGRENIENILRVFLYPSDDDDDSFGVKLRLKSGMYTIASDLSEIESTWLVREIQDWLDSR